MTVLLNSSLMIVLVVDNISMVNRGILEAITSIDSKVCIVSATDRNELPKDYIVDDFIRLQHEFLINRLDDFILTQNDYSYIDLELPVKHIVPIKVIAVDILIDVEAFNPNAPTRGTP